MNPYTLQCGPTVDVANNTLRCTRCVYLQWVQPPKEQWEAVCRHPSCSEQWIGIKDVTPFWCPAKKHNPVNN